MLAPFSFSSWRDALGEGVAPRAVVLDLPPEFVAFLAEEGVVLHEQSRALPRRSRPADVVVAGVDYDPDDTYSSSSSTDSGSAEPGSDSASDEQERQAPWCARFPQLHAAIEAGIAQLGGHVAPKLNWSSPSDAIWLSSYNSLQCSNADQVILLLKSSDRVGHDLEQLQALSAPGGGGGGGGGGGAQPAVRAQLVLREWLELQPEREFRCFVHRHAPVAISQRDPSQHFPQLADPAALACVRGAVLAFHAASVAGRLQQESYALDLHVPAAGRVQLLDVNPIAPTTSPLLFSWNELPFAAMHAAELPQQPPAGPGQQQQRQQQQQQQQGSGKQQQGPGAQLQGASEQPAQREAAGGGVEVRVVRDAGSILPGLRNATGMPLDMLGLPGAFEQVLGRMQAAEQQQQRSKQQLHQ